MFELTLRLESNHPLARFTKTHPTMKGRIFVHADSRGQTFTVQVVKAGRPLRDEYRRAYERSAFDGGCGSLQASNDSRESATYLCGPCTCGGRNPACADLRRMQDLFQSAYPGRARLTDLSFDRGRCYAQATYFEVTLPVAPPKETAASLPRQAPALLVESARRLIVEEATTDFSLGRLRPIEAETLREAVRLGYYETPRRCTMEDIARVIGITKSAVCHRLHLLEHKAIRRLMQGQSLAEPDAPPATPRVVRESAGTPVRSVPVSAAGLT